jgi:muramoyltetrapeptide carboxypeptidase
MSTITPAFLKKGALFGLVSPAGKIDPDVIPLAAKFLEKNGFPSRKGKYADGNHYQFAASDEARTADMQAMIDDPEIEAIWCCRGGYGAIRIIENLDFSLLIHHPKWLIGFSDITVFHANLQNILHVASIHGPMPVNLPVTKANSGGWQHLIDLLQGRKVFYHIEPHSHNRKGTSAGELTGGNLSLLGTLIGTRYDFDPPGKVLFIEEVGEHLYHIDRMMHHLKLSGKLKGLAGLVVGQITGIKDNQTPFGNSAEEIIKQAVECYDYPVLFGFPAGHGTPNEPLIMGALVHIQVTDEGGLMVYT